MENVVYFLGAGFSAPLGLPVMSNFIEKAKDIYYIEGDKKKGFEKVFKKLDSLSKIHNYFQTDLSNIEEVLSILWIKNSINKPNNFNDFVDFISQTLLHYQSKLKLSGTRYTGNWSSHLISQYDPKLNSYAEFILSISNATMYMKNFVNQFVGQIDLTNENEFHYDVVTLNYDTIIEKIAQQINNNTIRDGQRLSYQKNEFEENNKIPCLLKLHGCIEDGSIVPPTWSKNINKKIAHIWKRAHSVLSNAHYIRFIGYSLPETDSYIKYLLKSAMLDSEHLKGIDVICLDYDGSVYNRYKQAIKLKNFRFFKGDFMDVLNRYTDKHRVTTGEIRKFTDFEHSYNSFMKERGIN